MPNIIPRSGLWATPATTHDLLEQANALTGAERALVLNYIMMAFNLAAKMRDEDIEELLDVAQTEYGLGMQIVDDLKQQFEIA